MTDTPPAAEPTRLINPGTHTPPRLVPAEDGLIDLRTLPLEFAPPTTRRLAVAAVGLSLGTEFEVRDLPEDAPPCPPGTVVISYCRAATQPKGDGWVTVSVELTVDDGVQVAGVWAALDASWPEIVRTTATFAARHQPGSIR